MSSPGMRRFAWVFKATGLPFVLAVQVVAASPDDLIRRGDRFDAQNKTLEALESYHEADKLRPNHADTLRRIAREYSQLMEDTSNRAEKKRLAALALDHALRARNLAPDNAQVRLNLAICYGKAAFLEPPRRRMQVSRVIYEEALAATQLDPSDPLAWHVLGRWQYEVANLNPALRAIAQTLYGRFPEASNEKAVEYLEKSVRLAPPTVLYHAELGRAYAALGEKEKAREQLEKALRLPDRAKDDAETKKRVREVLKSL